MTQRQTYVAVIATREALSRHMSKTWSQLIAEAETSTDGLTLMEGTFGEHGVRHVFKLEPGTCALYNGWGDVASVFQQNF